MEFFTVINSDGTLESFHDYPSAKSYRDALVELSHDPDKRYNIVHTVIEMSSEGFFGHVYSEIKSHTEEDL